MIPPVSFRRSKRPLLHESFAAIVWPPNLSTFSREATPWNSPEEVYLYQQDLVNLARLRCGNRLTVRLYENRLHPEIDSVWRLCGEDLETVSYLPRVSVAEGEQPSRSLGWVWNSIEVSSSYRTYPGFQFSIGFRLFRKIYAGNSTWRRQRGLLQHSRGYWMANQRQQQPRFSVELRISIILIRTNTLLRRHYYLAFLASIGSTLGL